MSDEQPESENTVKHYEHEKWLYELNRAVAERDHDREINHGVLLNEAAINNSNLAARALLIINGGAAIAVLALIGRLIPSKPEDWLSISPLIESLKWFACGVTVTAVAMVFAYFTNYSNASVSYTRDFHYEHPYVRDNKKSSRWECRGKFSQIVTVIFAGLAIIFFWLGIREMDEIIKAFQEITET